MFTLLADLTRDGMAVLLVTHDIPALADTGTADRLPVMYAGHVVDIGPTHRLLDSPKHPYTATRVAALPASGLQILPGVPPR